ncbi:MAG: H-NS family nucleoid-associated regulatory protein [Sulfitobacter sp.]
MAIDLKSMNSKELEKLLGEVKKALQSAKARDRRKALKAAEKAAAEWGFTLTDLSEDGKPAKKQRKNKAKVVKPKSKPQFANPADKTQTWTGKGRQPNWFRAEVEKGSTPDSMRI